MSGHACLLLTSDHVQGGPLSPMLASCLAIHPFIAKLSAALVARSVDNKHRKYVENTVILNLRTFPGWYAHMLMWH